MSGQTGIFAGQNPALVGNELLQKVDVFEVEGVDGEIDLGFGPRSAHFGERTAAAGAAPVGLVGSGFARHRGYLISR